MASATRSTNAGVKLDPARVHAGPNQQARHGELTAYARRRRVAVSVILLAIFAPFASQLLIALQPAWSPEVSPELLAAAEIILVAAVAIAWRLRAAAAMRTRLRYVHDASRVLAQDLRTPLATVALISQALRMHVAEQPAVAGQLGQLSNRLEDIVRSLNQMLDTQVTNAALDRIDSRTRQELRAGDLVAHAIETYAFRGERERGLIMMMVRRDFKLRGSPQALERTIHNLIKNSLTALHAKEDAPRPGDIQIEVGTFQGRGRIVITDRGCGIEEVHQGRVLDPFFTTTPGDTHGLGLAYAKAAIHHAGGSLHIKSTAGKGTTAIAELPMATRAGVGEA